jgi:hypothetical protein
MSAFGQKRTFRTWAIVLSKYCGKEHRLELWIKERRRTMSIKQFGYLFIVSVVLVACCSEEFDLSSQGQGSMAGAAPTVSEENIACVRAKANAKDKCESICAANKNSTDPKVKEFTEGDITVYSECSTVGNPSSSIVNAFYGAKCKCCKP